MACCSRHRVTGKLNNVRLVGFTESVDSRDKRECWDRGRGEVNGEGRWTIRKKWNKQNGK